MDGALMKGLPPHTLYLLTFLRPHPPRLALGFVWYVCTKEPGQEGGPHGSTLRPP